MHSECLADAARSPRAARLVSTLGAPAGKPSPARLFPNVATVAFIPRPLTEWGGKKEGIAMTREGEASEQGAEREVARKVDAVSTVGIDWYYHRAG